MTPNYINNSGRQTTAVWQYGGFWAFLESSLFIESFVYICDGSVLKVRHIAKLRNVGKKSPTSSQQAELSKGRSSFRPSPNLTFPQAETPSESSACYGLYPKTVKKQI